MRTFPTRGRRTLAAVMVTGVVAGVLALAGANSIAGATENNPAAETDSTLGEHDEKL